MFMFLSWRHDSVEVPSIHCSAKKKKEKIFLKKFLLTLHAQIPSVWYVIKKLNIACFLFYKRCGFMFLRPGMCVCDRHINIHTSKVAVGGWECTLNLETAWKSCKTGLLCFAANTTAPHSPLTPAHNPHNCTRLITHRYSSLRWGAHDKCNHKWVVTAVSPALQPHASHCSHLPRSPQGGWQARWGLLSPVGLSADTKRGLRAAGSNDSQKEKKRKTKREREKKKEVGGERAGRTD